jgi:Predicted membrane protein (DUF2306)
MKLSSLYTHYSKLISSISWWIMLGFSILVSFLASRYLTLDSSVYFPEQKLVYITHSTGLIFHISGAIVANLIGPFLFVPKLRSHPFLKLHRGFGSVYLLGVLLGGVGGLYLSFLAYGGLITQLGFMSLGVLWLWTGYRAYHHIRNKRIALHREWMIRNYSLTYAGVMLRLWQVLGMMVGLEFSLSYAIVAWLSWIPNLLVAEWIIQKTRLPIVKM